jgi:hypothetical protein
MHGSQAKSHFGLVKMFAPHARLMEFMILKT